MRWLVVGLGLVAVVACQKDAPQKQPEGPTYFADIKPLVETRCLSCHDGHGIGPMPLTTLDALRDWKDVIREVVENRSMPPWKADNSCTDYKNNRSLSDAQVEMVLRWIDSGLPEGDPADEPTDTAVVDPGLSRVDLTLTVDGEYAPGLGDDYRCFALPWPETTTKFITGFNIVPTDPSVVHHVNIFGVPPEKRAHFMNKQASDATPGFNCAGTGVYTPGVALLGSWAPGSHGMDFPAGTGLPMEPGSTVILEMHFNGRGDDTTDQSSYTVSLADTVEKRAIIAAFWDFLKWPRDQGMLIPAGASDTMFTTELDPSPFVPIYAPWITSDRLKVYIAGVHMHYLGTQGYLSVKNDFGRNDCMLQINDWDFAWQSGYTLQQPMDVELGRDRVYLECHFDNSAANQAVVRGVKQTPRDVEWGEDSLDEMCIGFAYLTEG